MVVRELKRKGEMSVSTLAKNLKMPEYKLKNKLYMMLPSIAINGDNVNLNKEYDFVACSINQNMSIVNRRIEHNNSLEKEMESNEILKSNHNFDY
jgi:hypothetical protein